MQRIYLSKDDVYKKLKQNSHCDFFIIIIHKPGPMTSNRIYPVETILLSDDDSTPMQGSTPMSRARARYFGKLCMGITLIIISIGAFIALNPIQGPQQINNFFSKDNPHQTNKRSLQELIDNISLSESNLDLGMLYQKTSQKCKIIQKDTIRPYPSVIARSYYIAFNQTTMQPIFVKYIQPYFTNSCTTCDRFKKDPYGIDILSHEDYQGTGYDRGHLVPSADYGADTYIITNTVPMLPRFNRGAWRISEEMIRDKYKGRLIYKGCEYTNKTIITKKNNTLYIPIGCSYVVFDSNDVNQISELELLDHGYLENINTMGKTLSSSVKKLPDWIECSNNNIFASPRSKFYHPINLQSNTSSLSNTHGEYVQKLSSTYGPGDYRLAPQDYHYVDQIVVEIWGAGGAGGAGSAGGVGRNIMGGGGGAYITANITTNQQYIDIHVGYGGAGVERYKWTTGLYPICISEHTCNNSSARSRDSWIRIYDNSSDNIINLTAGGGMDGGCTARNSTNGGIVTMDNTSDIYAVPGNSGSDKTDGGSTPFGGAGGNATHRDGQVPGGGGAARLVCPKYPHTVRRLSRGGDGMIKIFF